MKKAFGNAHEHAYGYQDKERPVQIVNYRVSAVGLSDKPEVDHIQERSASVPKENEVRQVRFEKQCKFIETPVYLRDDLPSDCVLQGPAIIEQMDSTCVIPPGWTALSDQYGNILKTYEYNKLNNIIKQDTEYENNRDETNFVNTLSAVVFPFHERAASDRLYENT